MRSALISLFSLVISFVAVYFIIPITESSVTISISMISKNNVKFPIDEVITDSKGYNLKNLERLHGLNVYGLNSEVYDKNHYLELKSCSINNVAINIECTYHMTITGKNYSDKEDFENSINDTINKIYDVFETDLNFYKNSLKNTYLSLKKNKYEGAFFDICKELAARSTFESIKTETSIEEIARCYELETTFIRVYREYIFFDPEFSELGEPFHKFNELNYFLVDSINKELQLIYNFWYYKTIIFSLLYFLLLFTLIFSAIKNIFK